jgi:hypothetical protein
MPFLVIFIPNVESASNQIYNLDNEEKGVNSIALCLKISTLPESGIFSLRIDTK